MQLSFLLCHVRGIGLQYLPFRACVGLWMSLLLVSCATFNLSAAVKYITRFTEENFALFIAFIFVAGAFEKLAGVLHQYPMAPSRDCVCAGVHAHGPGTWHGFPDVENSCSSGGSFGNFTEEQFEEVRTVTVY